LNALAILGAGAFARETLDVAEAINAVRPTWDILGFIVDARYSIHGTIINDKPILGDLDWLAAHPDVAVVCGVGAPEVRLRMVEQAAAGGARFAAGLVHPSALVTRWMTIGVGTVIAAGCVMSNTIRIADHVHLNPSCTIGHDVVIESCVSLGPGVLISGNVTLREGAYIGTGTSIIEKRTVGAWSIVGRCAAGQHSCRRARQSDQNT